MSSHNPGPLAAGMFASPLGVFLATLRLRSATALKRYMAGNLAAFLLVVAIYTGLLPLDLRANAGAVQRLGALVMLLPSAVLGVWLVRSSPGSVSA